MNRDNQQRSLSNKERSTTIESIAIEKYYSEEVSRVHLIIGFINKVEMRGMCIMVIVIHVKI
jgi:hypothetical protein